MAVRARIPCRRRGRGEQVRSRQARHTSAHDRKRMHRAGLCDSTTTRHRRQQTSARTKHATEPFRLRRVVGGERAAAVVAEAAGRSDDRRGVWTWLILLQSDAIGSKRVGRWRDRALSPLPLVVLGDHRVRWSGAERSGTRGLLVWARARRSRRRQKRAGYRAEPSVWGPHQRFMRPWRPWAWGATPVKRREDNK